MRPNYVCIVGGDICSSTIKGKDKGHPRRGHEYPEREKRYSSTVSLTSASDAGS
jgi:hypothetical protein